MVSATMTQKTLWCAFLLKRTECGFIHCMHTDKVVVGSVERLYSKLRLHAQKVTPT